MASTNASRLQRCETQLQDFLAEALRGVQPDSLSATMIPGKWSAHQNLAHLARYHQIFLERINRILAEEAPVFSPLSRGRRSRVAIVVGFAATASAGQAFIHAHQAYGPVAIFERRRLSTHRCSSQARRDEPLIMAGIFFGA